MQYWLFNNVAHLYDTPGSGPYGTAGAASPGPVDDGFWWNPAVLGVLTVGGMLAFGLVLILLAGLLVPEASPFCTGLRCRCAKPHGRRARSARR